MKSYWQNYRIKLHNLSEEKINAIFDIANAFRYCYNWGLEFCNTAYAEGRRHPTLIDMTTAFTEFRNREGNEWLQKYNVATCRYALMNVRTAFEKFFNKFCRYPKFKSKKYAEVKFKINGCKLSFHGDGNRYAHIPGLGRRQSDLIDCKKHNIPVGPNVNYHNVYIKYDGIDFWLSLSVETFVEEEEMKAYGEPLGIDVGYRTSAALSDGTMYDPPNKHRLNVLDNRKRKIQSAISRDRNRRYKEARRMRTKYDEIPKSKNELKRELRYKKTSHQISNLYKSHFHKISREIANRKPEYVVLEDLDVQHLLSKDKRPTNHYVHDARLAMLIEYISYKCESVGSEVIYAPSNFPSTKTCSRCGHIKPKIYGNKIYVCPTCGLRIDRDLNAAINLKKFGETARLGQSA